MQSTFFEQNDDMMNRDEMSHYIVWQQCVVLIGLQNLALPVKVEKGTGHDNDSLKCFKIVVLQNVRSWITFSAPPPKHCI